MSYLSPNIRRAAGAALLAASALISPALAQVDVRTGEIVRAPTDVPPPIGDREPTTINVELTTQELIAHLDSGTTFRYWTFNGAVPGPMIRARVGDTVNVSVKNPLDSQMVHNIDFHAATPEHCDQLLAVAPGLELEPIQLAPAARAHGLAADRVEAAQPALAVVGRVPEQRERAGRHVGRDVA